MTLGRTVSAALLVAASVLMLGCGEPLGSCSATTGAAPVCIDYEAFPFPRTTLEERCNGVDQAYHPTPCSPSGRVGRCRRVQGAGDTRTIYVTNFYAPLTAEQAQRACEQDGSADSPSEFIP
jgi:hypothetical protein